MTWVLSFLELQQAAQLQGLDHFWYDKAVSRIQTRFFIGGNNPLLFTVKDTRDSDKIWSFEPISMRIEVMEHAELFDFSMFTTV